MAPATVEEALAQLRRAQALACGDPPAVTAGAALVETVEAWLRRVGSEDNQYRCFHGRGINRHWAQCTVSQAIGQVAALTSGLRRVRPGRPARPGAFVLAIGAITAAREYLVILGDEQAIAASKLVRDAEQASKVMGTIAVTVVGVPLVLSLAAEIAVGSGLVTVMLLNPIETVVLGELGLGVVLQLGMVGDLRTFLEGRLTTPEGIVQTAFELVIVYGILHSPRGAPPRPFVIELEEVEAREGRCAARCAGRRSPRRTRPPTPRR